MRDSTAEKRRTDTVLSKLATQYPNPASELCFHNEYELLIAVVLSAQCTDKKVNEVTKTLFTRYPDFTQLAGAKLEDVSQIIRAVNYYRTKAANIIKLATLVCAHHHGALPHSYDALIALPGVGNKTASVVLGELKITPTFPVDTHVFRVSQRLGFAKGKTVEIIEAQLKKRFPPELWRNLHHWLILHGRRVCKAQNPACEDCVLNTLCPTGKKHLKGASQ